MATVTIFTPLMEGLFDSEYGPHVYQGELSREQVLEIGRKLGDCYARTAICGSPEGGWYVSYHSQEADEGDCVQPHEAENGGSFEETPGCGALSYSVEYCEINPAPVG